MQAATNLRMIARRLAHAGIAVVMAAAALSCASRPQTSRPAPIIERAPIVRTVPEPAQVAPEPPPEAATVETMPLSPPEAIEPAPAVPEIPVQEARPSRPPPATSDAVALILPLEIPEYARAADAVRAGFIAAADVAGQRDKCIVIGYKQDGVIAAFEAARSRGVRVVVGPLLRDDLKTLAMADPVIPWTIALNQLDDRASLPPAIFSFALTIEADARVLARQVIVDGARSVDVISSDAPLMRRFASTFTADWTAGGGAAPADFRFDPSPEALSTLRRNLTRALPDAVLLAVDGTQAALVKPFVGTIASYASGLVFERPDRATARDLNDVRIVEIPWLITPDAPQLANYPRADYESAGLQRLYALGLDAFRVSQSFGADPPTRFELDGATGHVVLDDHRQFVREGTVAVFRDGQLVPLDGSR